MKGTGGIEGMKKEIAWISTLKPLLTPFPKVQFYSIHNTLIEFKTPFLFLILDLLLLVTLKES